jgi:hypothetical protein
MVSALVRVFLISAVMALLAGVGHGTAVVINPNVNDDGASTELFAEVAQGAGWSESWTSGSDFEVTERGFEGYVVSHDGSVWMPLSLGALALSGAFDAGEISGAVTSVPELDKVFSVTESSVSPWSSELSRPMTFFVRLGNLDSLRAALDWGKHDNFAEWAMPGDGLLIAAEPTGLAFAGSGMLALAALLRRKQKPDQRLLENPRNGPSKEYLQSLDTIS